EPITSETIFPAARRVFRNQHSAVEEMVGNMVMERTVNPARHCRGTPARSPQDRVPMRTIEVFGCAPSSFFNFVAVPMQAFMMNDLRCKLLAEVETLRNATRANDDGGVDDGEDPVGFRAAPVLVGLVDKWRVLPIGGGNTAADKVFTQRMLENVQVWAIDCLGDIPSPATITSAQDARRYLKPYLFKPRS
ncbi:unnamed protein product, partial [Pylaiella littoralis]